MKLYRIEPYYDGVQGEAKYLAAIDDSQAIHMVECDEVGAILEDNPDYYDIGYDVVYVKDLQNQPDLCKWEGKDIFKLTDEQHKVYTENKRERMLLEAERWKEEPWTLKDILGVTITCFFLIALLPQLITAAVFAFFFILVFMNGLND